VAFVAPFRGLHYNPEKVSRPEEVVTPPYDVIKPREREAFAARHPYNMVHLILPQPRPGDNQFHNRYTRAAALYRQWVRDGILVRDPEPAFYYWETEFQVEGRAHNRAGFVALVRLESLTGGVIRPHEQTFSAAKADRLELLKNAQANFSPIFSLYPDPENRVLQTLRQARPAEPLMDFIDVGGYHNRFYRVTRPEALTEAHQALLDKALFIADGHHRYETSLNYQKLMKQRYPQASPFAAFNFTLMYLSNLSDPDLVILMAHRMLGGPRFKTLEEGAFLKRMGEYFEIEPLPGPGQASGPYEEFLQQKLKEVQPRDTVFIVLGFGRKAWRVRLKPGIREKVLERQMHRSLAQLDVTVLNFLIFEKVLGLDAKAQDDQETCKYSSKIPDVLAALERREASLAFILNPTRIEQVQEVASTGFIMPRKSTYFYPKVMTGLILNPINPEEEIRISSQGPGVRH
jgi:uncharacterized protein (DUF1015 family)